MIEARTVTKVTQKVVDYDEVKDEVLEVLKIGRLEELGFDFWWDVWLKIDDDVNNNCISDSVVNINRAIEIYKENSQVLRVLHAFREVLGEELSNGVHFEYCW